MRIVVFGSLNLDTVLSVERRPHWGETILANDLATAPGGKGANQAAAAARLGHEQVIMVGRVGADGAGTFLRASLASSGVTDGVRIDPLRPTGGATILRNRTGQNAIVVATGANDAAVVDDLTALEDPGQPTLLVLQLEIPVGVAAAAVAFARPHGWHVLLNTAPVRPEAASLVPDVDTLVANELEAGQLTARPVHDVTSALQAARVLLERGPSRVAVTLGERGAVLLDRDQAWFAAAPAVAVVDTTAAGDAFVGGLSVATAEGRGGAEALALAVAAGSLATTRAGAQPSLPSRAEVERLAASVRPVAWPPAGAVVGGPPM